MNELKKNECFVDDTELYLWESRIYAKKTNKKTDRGIENWLYRQWENQGTKRDSVRLSTSGRHHPPGRGRWENLTAVAPHQCQCQVVGAETPEKLLADRKVSKSEEEGGTDIFLLLAVPFSSQAEASRPRNLGIRVCAPRHSSFGGQGPARDQKESGLVQDLPAWEPFTERVKTHQTQEHLFSISAALFTLIVEGPDSLKSFQNTWYWGKWYIHVSFPDEQLTPFFFFFLRFLKCFLYLFLNIYFCMYVCVYIYRYIQPNTGCTQW